MHFLNNLICESFAPPLVKMLTHGPQRNTTHRQMMSALVVLVPLYSDSIDVFITNHHMPRFRDVLGYS